MDALQCRRWEQEYFLRLDDHVQRQAPLQHWFVSDQALERALASLASTPLTDDERQLLATCRLATSHYRQAFVAIVGEIERGLLTTPQAASDALLARVIDKQDATILAHDLANYNFVELTQNEAKLANSLRATAVGIGLALGVMIASFSLIDNQLPYGVLLGWLMVFGAINSLQFSAMNTLTLQDLSPEFASSGNGLLSVVMQLSMSLGVATSSALLLLFSGGVGVGPGHQAGAALMPAFRGTYLAIGVMAALAAFIFAQLRAHEGSAEAGESLQD